MGASPVRGIIREHTCIATTCLEQENCVESTTFTPQVQDSSGQSNSEHFDEESRDYPPSNSRENQSKDDSQSTDDGFDQFADHQVNLSTSRQWLCLSRMTSEVFFPPID